MTHDRLPSERDVNRNADSRVSRRALIAGALATVTALGIGGVVGKDIFKSEQGVSAHDNGSDKENREVHLRPIDDLIEVEYGGFAASGDPSLFIGVDQALTVQLEGTPGDLAGSKGGSDVQFVVAQMPDGAGMSKNTTFANTFIYGEDGTPYPTQTVDELTDDEGHFTLTVPLRYDTGSQHLYIVPMLVGEEITPAEFMTADYLDIPFSFDSAGVPDLTSIPGRG